MVRREKIEGVILSRKNIGEADRLLTLFSEKYGLLKVMAKGVRKIPSRRGGHLEPMTRILGIVQGNKGYYYLAAVETLNHYADLRDDNLAMSCARNICGLIAALFEQEDVQSEYYWALEHALRILPELSLAKKQLLEVTLTLYGLDCAGIAPRFNECGKCNRQKPSDSVVLDGVSGRWYCLLCHGSLSGAQAALSPKLLKVLRFVQKNPAKALNIAAADDEAQQLADAMRFYVLGATGKRFEAYDTAQKAGGSYQQLFGVA